jgi:WD40 repeat protein
MKIFISYSSKSRTVVEALAVDLEALGYTVWFDRELTGGQDWWEEILHSIRRCQLFLYALTPEALDSYACKLEFEYATALNKRIMPVMLADINISALATALQKVQIVDYRKQNKQQALALGKALNSLPPTKPLPKPLPNPPEMPLPLVTRLRDQIEKSILTGDEQKTIIAQLRDLLQDQNSVQDARMLLRQLHERDDLLARVEKEILGLLNGKVSGKARSAGNTETQRFVGHTEPVFGVAASPDNETILTGSVDTTARLWDATTGEELRRFIGHTASVWNVAFSPNGRTVLTSSRDSTARLWDATTGEELRRFAAHTDSIWGIAYSPDGHTVLTGSFDKTARLWDVTTGRELARLNGHRAAVWGVAYAPDGCTVLTGSWDKTVRLWDATTGEELRQFIGHNSPVVNVAYSPDGHTILTSDRDATARLWDVKTGRELRRFVSKGMFCAAYSPDGNHILTGGADKVARLWDAHTGEELHLFAGHTDAVTAVAFSSDGAFVLTGSADRTAQFWDLGDLSSGDEAGSSVNTLHGSVRK